MATNTVFFFYDKEYLRHIMGRVALPEKDRYQFQYIQPLQPLRRFEGYVFIDWYGLKRAPQDDEAILKRIKNESGYTEQHGDLQYSMYSKSLYAPIADQVVPYSLILGNAIAHYRMQNGFLVDSVGISETGSVEFSSELISKDTVIDIHLVTVVRDGRVVETHLFNKLDEAVKTLGFQKDGKNVHYIHESSEEGVDVSVKSAEPNIKFAVPSIAYGDLVRREKDKILALGLSTQGIALVFVFLISISVYFFVSKKNDEMLDSVRVFQYPRVEWLEARRESNLKLYVELQRVIGFMTRYPNRYRLHNLEISVDANNYVMHINLAWLPISKLSDAQIMADQIGGEVVESESLRGTNTMVRKVIPLEALP